MEFHSPALSDHNWVQDAFDFGQTDCCEYCFGNIFMWSDIYDNKIYNDNGIFVSADFTDEPVFCYPIGKGDKKRTIEKLIDFSKGLGVTLEFFGMTEKDRDELQFLFPNHHANATIMIIKLVTNVKCCHDKKPSGSRVYPPHPKNSFTISLQKFKRL